VANAPGPQPDVQYCPACKAPVRNIPRGAMKSKGYRRRDGTVAPDTHTYECTSPTCGRRFEINQDRP
jgi:hypothetical protein